MVAALISNLGHAERCGPQLGGGSSRLDMMEGRCLLVISEPSQSGGDPRAGQPCGRACRGWRAPHSVRAPLPLPGRAELLGGPCRLSGLRTWAGSGSFFCGQTVSCPQAVPSAAVREDTEHLPLTSGPLQVVLCHRLLCDCSANPPCSVCPEPARALVGKWRMPSGSPFLAPSCLLLPWFWVRM